MARPKQFDPEVAVSAAKDLFWRKGYGATTPADLVDALGIGKGSLYNTFTSKHALFEQALGRYGDERVAGLIALLGKPGPVKARLHEALERLAAPELAELRRHGCLAVNTAAELGEHDEAAAAIVRSVFDRMERALRAAIEEGQQRGEIARNRDAKELASVFVTTIIGMSVLAKTADRTGRARRVVNALMAML